MSYVEITMHVFSGRENPKWTIDGNHHKFQDVVAGVEKHGKKGEIKFGLGYSGFTIRHGIEIYKIGKVSNTDLEKLLVHTSDQGLDTTSSSSAHKPIISNILKDHVLGQLDGTSVKKEEPKLPTYEPGKWNISSVQPYNNCYNYANNMKTNTFAQPGRYSGYSVEEITGSVVQKYATADGLQEVNVGNSDKVPTDCRNLVALVIWPYMDFHWYRLDKNKNFSHKPGGTEVRNCDENKKEIADPRKCNRGPYTEFVTFMKTDPQVVNIK